MRFNRTLQCLECETCHARFEISRWALRNPEHYLSRLEDAERNHKCMVRVPVERVRRWDTGVMVARARAVLGG